MHCDGDNWIYSECMSWQDIMLSAYLPYIQFPTAAYTCRILSLELYLNWKCLS